MFFASCYVLFVGLYLVGFTLPFYALFVFFFSFLYFFKKLNPKGTSRNEHYAFFKIIFFFFISSFFSKEAAIVQLIY